MACGTGACAVQVAARLNGLAGDRATIALPGGDLTVEWPGEGEVVMEGPVATVFDGEWRGLTGANIDGQDRLRGWGLGQ